MIKGIDHINLVVTNLEEAERFFEILGFKKNASSVLEGDWIGQVVGLSGVKAQYISLAHERAATRVEIIKYFSPKEELDPSCGAANKVGIRHLAFEVEDIASVYQALKEKGFRFLSAIQEYKATNKKLVYFLGPDGILFELAEYQRP